VVGATLAVVVVGVVDVVVVVVVVDISGTIKASTSTRLDEAEVFEFCSLLHANKRLALSSGRRKRNFI
jgi:hypothetical protein